jgi:hypothetical protein
VGLSILLSSERLKERTGVNEVLAVMMKVGSEVSSGMAVAYDRSCTVE